ECAVNAERLALIKAGERFIGRYRVFEVRSSVDHGAGSEIQASNEVFVQLSIDAEARTDAGAMTVDASRAAIVGLEEALTAYPHVARETEASDQGFHRSQTLLVVLATEGSVLLVELHIRHVGLQLFQSARRRLSGRSLSSCLFGRRARLICR